MRYEGLVMVILTQCYHNQGLLLVELDFHNWMPLSARAGFLVCKQR